MDITDGHACPQCHSQDITYNKETMMVHCNNCNWVGEFAKLTVFTVMIWRWAENANM